MPADPWSRWSDRQRRLLEAIGPVPWPIGQVAGRRADAPGDHRMTASTSARAAGEAAGLPSAAAGADAPHAGPAARAPARAEAPTLRPEGRSGAVRPTRPNLALAPDAAPGAGPATGRRPDGIGQMGWSPLAEAVAGCTACKLCGGRTQAVLGTGRHDAHWLIVGEAPGEQEDLRGEPFVGKSGQLLDAMLAAIGVSRDPEGTDPARAAYIANTVKCRPPGNRNPEPEELAQCEPYLIRQIELLKPRLILAMGRFAVQSLLRSDEAIGRLRGRVHRYQGVPLVVTYHPAYLLRNPLDKARAWEDLCLARAQFDAG